MRAMVIAWFLVGAIAPAAAASPSCRLYYWAAASTPLGDAARAGFVDGTREHGGKLEVLSATATGSPDASPAVALDAARADYRRFAYAEALARFDALEREVNLKGGADLDNRQLSDLFFYRWLSRTELGRSEGAWDDLVQAARLAPARLLDGAQVPPRAMSAWRRALAEVAALPRGWLSIEAPADATLRIDGLVSAPTGELAAGPHFVRIEAAGFEAWAGVVQLAASGLRLAPPLRPRPAPDIETLPATDGGCVVLGALVRSAAGWRFVVRALAVQDGKLHSEAVALGEDTAVRAEVLALARRVSGTLAAPSPVPLVAIVSPSEKPKALSDRRRMWIGLGIGWGVAVSAALAVSLGVVYGRGAAGGTVATEGGVR